jgi:hypothetical protein
MQNIKLHFNFQQYTPSSQLFSVNQYLKVQSIQKNMGKLKLQ